MSEIKTKKNFGYRRVPNGDGINSAKYAYKKFAKEAVNVDETEYNTQKTTNESDYEQRRVNSLLHVIFKICELSGFWVDNRIVLKDRKTGKIWK
jgi:hypothetical protein